MIGIPFHGEGKITEQVHKPALGVQARSTFTFAPHEGGTKLDFEVDYTIPIPVLGKLAEKVVFKRNQREVQLSMENLRDRLEV